MELLKLEIVTPDGLIFSGNVKTVTLPGSEGEFGVYAGHASLVSLLKAGVVDIELENAKREMVAINWGHVKVDEHSVAILADGAISISHEESQIADSLEKAKKLIESMGDSDVALATVTARIETFARTNK
ncbi:MAG: F0F1 ATP synthase subunit epsilon [Sulfurospirillum sp.]|nr:F0F1 ATP synthase subunit epsilon [Sulfurospirillum sp.]